MTKKTYRVRGIDLDIDNERYPEGSEVELADEAAAPLGRWLEPAAPGNPTDPKKTTGAKK